MKTISVCLCVLAILIVSNSAIYDQYLAESRKIAKAMSLEEKIGQTIQLTFEGITQKTTTEPSEALKYFLGSLLVNGGGAPTTDGNLAKLNNYLEEDKNKQIYLNATATNWKKLTDKFNNIGVSVTTAEKKKYLIKLLLGTDAVHGDQHTVGNVIFPHNIGLSCSHNPGNFENVGFWTKQGMKKSGFNFAFAPCVAVTHNPQWGRTYESMGQEDDFIQEYAKSFVKGLQDVSNGKINGVLGSAKHFMADGATRYGANEGTATVGNFKNFIEHNVKGYRGAISSEIGNVMVSYSAINYVPNSLNSAFLMGVLRGEENFAGFTISDYDDILRASTMSLPRTFINVTESDAYSLMINAGVDMMMISSHENIFGSLLQRIIKEAKKNVEKGHILEQRLEDAVTRILAVKFAMGLITVQNSEETESELFEQSEKSAEALSYPLPSSNNEYQDSLTAAQESLVVLKNSNNALPLKGLSSEIKYVVLVGESIININRLTRIELFRNFDNIGMQCGGWTVRWQGYLGNDFWTGANKVSSNASSVLDALKSLQSANNFSLIYPNYTTFTNEIQIEVERRQYLSQLSTAKKSMNSKNTLIIGVFGEVPYAESEGDVNIPYCKNQDLEEYCIYRAGSNPYVSGIQAKDMTVDFSKFELEIINEIRSADKNIPLVSVLFTGRPVPISNIFETSTAVIAGWLPGTSGGQSVVNLISGAYIAKPGGASDRKNTLSMDWPKSMKSLEDFPIYSADGSIPKIDDVQFSVGHGLSTSSNSGTQLKIE